MGLTTPAEGWTAWDALTQYIFLRLFFCLFSPPSCFSEVQRLQKDLSAPVARPGPVQFCWELKGKMLPSSSKDFEPGHSLLQVLWRQEVLCVSHSVCWLPARAAQPSWPLAAVSPCRSRVGGWFASLLQAPPKPPSGVCAWRVTDRKSFWVFKVQFGAGHSRLKS